MIPIQNIYYMLSYAFQTLQAENYKDLATENFHNTAELCAAILDKGFVPMMNSQPIYNLTKLLNPLYYCFLKRILQTAEKRV